MRYPGGKSRAIKRILPLIPPYKEFREPFVGGGSVFLAAKQQLNPKAIYKINDLNYDLYCFWKYAQSDLGKLVQETQHIKDTYIDGRMVYEELNNANSSLTDFERAVRFFILNRITFSGTVDSGGYSKQAFEQRFTNSSIERLALLDEPLQGVKISCGDYTDLLFESGKDVFIFLDPPYYKQAKSRLYGKNGDLHINFDHDKFAEDMKRCEHKWLITLDDSPKVRDIFSFANIYKWELQYGMNNYKQHCANKGAELFITNYDTTN